MTLAASNDAYVCTELRTDPRQIETCATWTLQQDVGVALVSESLPMEDIGAALWIGTSAILVFWLIGRGVGLFRIFLVELTERR